MKKFISSIYFLRIFTISLLKPFNFTFKWKHDITNRPFLLKFFDHKAYWFYGKEKYRSEIDNFYQLIQKGDKVLEVGTHIGYVTQIFEEIVGNSGQVLAVEPTSESINYLKKNVLPNTKIICKAASNYIGEAAFYTSNLCSLNSLNQEVTLSNSKKHNKLQNLSSKVNSIKVEVDTLDNICMKNNFKPTFIKIDVEGSELNVLRGAASVLNSLDALMVEISCDKNEIFKLLEKNGFKIFSEDLENNNYFFKK